MTFEEEARRVHLLYELLIEQIAVGRNTIAAELEKPKAEQDVFYMLGQVELNVAFEQAAMALENSGMIDDEALQCHECGELFVEHDDDDHGGDVPEATGDAPTHGVKPPKPSDLN